MNIDINKLSKGELLELNRRIIQRIKYLLGRETRELSKKFIVGDVVEFCNRENVVRGIVIRINRKTLSVQTKEGRWNVPPQFLRKVEKGGKKRHLEIVK